MTEFSQWKLNFWHDRELLGQFGTTESFYTNKVYRALETTVMTPINI